MSKDKKSIKEKKKAPAENVNKSSLLINQARVPRHLIWHPPTRKNNMEDKTIDGQTRLYLYDLMNAAKEHGFKADDIWELSLVTDTGRSKLQKDYYPTITAKLFPEVMLQVFHGIKEKLNQSFNKEEEQLDKRSLLAGELNYLVAYNPKRPRT